MVFFLLYYSVHYSATSSGWSTCTGQLLEAIISLLLETLATSGPGKITPITIIIITIAANHKLIHYAHAAATMALALSCWS